MALGELQRFGMIDSRRLGDDELYDERALLVARLAARFRTFGIEPRHLRAYKVAAEREAGLYEQVILPLLKQRDDQARTRGREQLTELVHLGDELRAVMLSQALDTSLPPD
jgi:hypothetical protein